MGCRSLENALNQCYLKASKHGKCLLVMMAQPTNQESILIHSPIQELKYINRNRIEVYLAI